MSTALNAAVLIVDSNPAAAESLADFLRKEGHTVRVATTGVGAVAALDGWLPDAAVLDLDAPDGGGVAAAETLAVRDRRPLLIGLLRPGAAPTIRREQQALFDNLWTKAVSPTVLAERIAGYVAKKTVVSEG